jgi:hypothetical protein
MSKIACARQSEICCTPAAAVQQNLDTRLHAQINMPCGKTSCARQSETCFTPAVGSWQNPDKPLHAQNNMSKTSCARQSEACVRPLLCRRTPHTHLHAQNNIYESTCAKQHAQDIIMIRHLDGTCRTCCTATQYSPSVNCKCKLWHMCVALI